MVCRTPRPKRELMRVVRSPDGRVVADPSGRVAGRGAYLCAGPACLRDARTKSALERALGTAMPAGLLDELADDIDQLTIQGGSPSGKE